MQWKKPCPLYPQKRTCAVQLGCPLWAKSGRARHYSITSSARASNDGGTVRTDYPGGLCINDHLELAYLPDRQIRWLRTLEDLSSINTGLPMSVSHTCAVAHQPTHGMIINGPAFPSGSHCTGTTAGAPLSLIKTTRNFAGWVLLAFWSMT